MPALLLWLGQFLLRTVASELFRKAAIFMAFNIILAFMLNFVTNNSFGVNVFGVGSEVGRLLNAINTGIVMYVLQQMGAVQGLFLILNAYLARFAYRLVFKALGR